MLIIFIKTILLNNLDNLKSFMYVQVLQRRQKERQKMNVVLFVLGVGVEALESKMVTM